MSGSFKTYPKPILSHNDIGYDPNRIDRYGKNFKFMEQHISFKDNILEEPLESILEIEQIIIGDKDEQETRVKEKSDNKETVKKKNIDKLEKHKRHKKSKKKHCSCYIQ